MDELQWVAWIGWLGAALLLAGYLAAVPGRSSVLGRHPALVTLVALTLAVGAAAIRFGQAL